jgi:hypothetical protein
MAATDRAVQLKDIKDALTFRVLSSDDRQHWTTWGYVIVRDAVPVEYIDRLKAFLWEFHEMDPSNPCTWNKRQLRDNEMHMDGARHRSAIGRDNAGILENARLAARLGIAMTIRVPVIPGFNDQPQEIITIGKFARSLGVRELHLLPYHPYGAAKNMTLGMEYQMAGTASPSQKCIEELRDELEKVGLLRTSSSLSDASPGLYYEVLS